MPILLPNSAERIERALISSLQKEQIKNVIHLYAAPYRELMAYYKCAIMEVETKFRVLSEELSLEYDHNPIETIKTRLKTPESIFEKLTKNNYPVTIESVERNISDVAGVRVICSYLCDIYMLADAFLAQDDITLIRKKDYIKNPKENGYRSLHLIVEIPIFLHDCKKQMKVEVQFRTIAMDMWASLEHGLCYKTDKAMTETDKSELLSCAETLSYVDDKMQALFKKTKTDIKE